MQISKIILCSCALTLGAALAVSAQDTPAQAAARKELLKQLGEPATPGSPAPAAPAPAPKSPAAKPAAPAAAAPAAAAPAAAVPTAPAVKTESPAAAKPAAPAKTAPASPLPPPPPAVPATKEQQLNELLIKYKAGHVTPQEYHAQRAAILAAP